MIRTIAISAFGATMIWAQPGVAEQPKPLSIIKDSEDKSHVTLSFVPGWYQISSEELSVNGIQFAAGFDNAFSQQWSGGVRMIQAYTGITNMTTLYTAFVASVEYAVTGSFMNKNRQIELDGWQVLSARSQGNSGFRIGLQLSQYFINTSKLAVPFSGAGLSLRWLRPFTPKISLALGSQLDAISNARQTLIPVAFTFGVSYLP